MRGWVFIERDRLSRLSWKLLKMKLFEQIEASRSQANRVIHQACGRIFGLLGHISTCRGWNKTYSSIFQTWDWNSLAILLISHTLSTCACLPLLPRKYAENGKTSSCTRMGTHILIYDEIYIELSHIHNPSPFFLAVESIKIIF